VDRKRRQLFDRVLALAQALAYVNRLRSTLHSTEREERRAIELADAEATILGHDARVVGRNLYHAEGTTFTISGRRANGDEIRVVVAFNEEDVEAATELRIVTLMYPKGMK
jgi:uncharacterized protein YpmB